MPSKITVVSIPVVKKKVATAAERVRRRVDALRKVRLLRRATKKREARTAIANAAAVVSSSALALAHRVSRLLHPLMKPWRANAIAPTVTAAVERVFGKLKAAAATMGSVKALGGAVRGLLQRLRSLKTAKLLVLPFSKQAKDKRQRVLRVVFRAAVAVSALAARVRRRLERMRLALQLARGLTESLIEQAVTSVAARVVCEFELQRKKAHVATIERVWAVWKARELDRTQRKQRLLAALSSAQTHLRAAETMIRTRRVVAARVAGAAMETVATELARRGAARLIQRLWRGSRARARAYAMLSVRKRKEFLKLQRERLRRARVALLGGDSRELAHQCMLAKRVAARQIKTPLKSAGAARDGMSVARLSLEQPLVQRRPPRVSAVTGARTLPVAFSKFEKIRSSNARVNPLNLWVAIPVGFEDVSTRVGANTRSPSLRPTFDWVPATLLRSPAADSKCAVVSQSSPTVCHLSEDHGSTPW